MILLTGASGFLGKAILSYYPKEVISLGRSGQKDIICDISKQIPELPIVDIVVHAAGKAHFLPKTEIERQMFFDVNVNGTKNLLKGLANNEVKPKSFIFISSVSVYGKECGSNINEETSLEAKDAYGLSKIEAENLIQKWCIENNVICTILRLPLIVGPNPPGNLGAMIKGIKRGYYLNIAGGKAKKSMVLDTDVADIIPFSAKIGGIYNLTDGYHPSFVELSEVISAKFGKRKAFNIPRWFIYPIAKIGDLLGANFPINSSKLNKITADLTFDDKAARQKLNWNPRLVLKNI
ncbi:NAD-dependent epimerase/dehydratase family protein [Pedobacter cryoconitis]|uniref:Nucleoside-diphosphate-sugar epimerase n=1 Tax=Pedobacter cryoconitis TaxID=188932 RepID=A0A7X0MKP3_9SPHI|nr:NAD-dependent epimerase/dehydratase family protein [Pedobacter cryoconitis]MBB6502414.1 nucleoside-diphosphate-sugar epimerase [Pedobacter cryoconitis]